MSKRGVEISDRETGQRYEVTNNKCTHPGCGGVIIQSIGGDPVCISCGRPAPAERPAAAVQQTVKPTPETVKPPDLTGVNNVRIVNGTPATESEPADPATPHAKRNTRKRNAEIEAQSTAIIFDYNAGMKLVDILGKYKISISAWYTLKKRHTDELIKKRERPMVKQLNTIKKYDPTFDKPSPAEDSKESDFLVPKGAGFVVHFPSPMFPDFDSKWPEPVQIKWLECYVELKKVNK